MPQGVCPDYTNSDNVLVYGEVCTECNLCGDGSVCGVCQTDFTTSLAPTIEPTTLLDTPSVDPTVATMEPSSEPTVSSMTPSSEPTKSTMEPTIEPSTLMPSIEPSTTMPSIEPSTSMPSTEPSVIPSATPSISFSPFSTTQPTSVSAIIQDPSNNQNALSASLSTGAITGIVVGSLVLLAVLLVLYWYPFYQRNSKSDVVVTQLKYSEKDVEMVIDTARSCDNLMVDEKEISYTTNPAAHKRKNTIQNT